MLLYRVRPSAVLDVAGADREAFLQGQLTSDVRFVSAGQVVPTAGLSPKGKLIFAGKLAPADDRLRLVLPARLRETVLAHLKKYAVFQKVALEDRTPDFVRFGIVGAFPGSAAGEISLGRDGEFDDDRLVAAPGAEEFTRALEAAGGRALGPDEAEVLRVEAGRPRFGQDYDESNLPDEVGMEDAISSTKGCYVGQEIVARLRTYGRVNRRLVGFRFPDGTVPEGSLLDRPGTAPDPARRPETAPGRVTSSVQSPRFGAIGLGWAFRDVPAGGELAFALHAETGDAGPGRARAIVSELPFA